MGKELKKLHEFEHLDEFTEILKTVDLREKSANYFVDMGKAEMLDFIEQQQRELLKVKRLIGELRTYADLFEIRSAKSIMKHWEMFNEFMEQNEEFKEEWDALCMAIRLKDD